MSQISEVAVIGLGAMGWGAATSLLEHGYTVYGVDARSEQLDAFAEQKGSPCATPAEAAAKAPIVMTFVVNDEQTEQVLFGDGGAVASAEPQTIFINCTTMPPASSIRIGERLESEGMRVVDAPVIGGAARAKRGELKVMVSGSDEVLELVDPVLDSIASRVLHLGDRVGIASQIKMLNQLLSGVHIAATAEAMTLAAKCGVDLAQMHDVISHSTGNSWMFEDRGSHIVNGDYAARSAIDIILKDLGIARSEAENVGSEIPLTRAALELFFEASASGLGREDGSALAKLLAQKSGAELPGVDADA